MTPNPMELKALAIGSFLSAAGSLASLIAVGIVFIDKTAASSQVDLELMSLEMSKRR